MNIQNISVPDIYKQSADFRTFLEWFKLALSKLTYDTENFLDLYDPLRCPDELLWMLADTMGFKYDDRMPPAYNRLVLLYFMSMIYNRGSKDGVTLSAEVNLAQFPLMDKAEGAGDDSIYYSRLEDTSIPVNSASVTPHPADGYIDIVYFSEEIPKDVCIEYTRPLGMFAFQHAGVRFDARTKISVDARLTDDREIGISDDIGPTFIGHYRREDYARMQKSISNTVGTNIDKTHVRHGVWSRNSDYEDIAYGDGSYGSGAGQRAWKYQKLVDRDGEYVHDANDKQIVLKEFLSKNIAGYRSLYSLQLANNENIVKSLAPKIFSVGFGPEDVTVTYPDDYLINPSKEDMEKPWNLRYDLRTDETYTDVLNSETKYIATIDKERSDDILSPRPAVNVPMYKVGDAIISDNKSKTTTD